MKNLFTPLELSHGNSLKNKILLAPLTTCQSLDNGIASEDDINWFDKVSKGGYSYIISGATLVQKNGKAFRGQIGIYDDFHIEGLKKIPQVIKSHNAISAIQLHHGGIRAAFSNDLVGPSQSLMTGARQLATFEVEELRDDFIKAALRAEKAGFDGVEVHGAFGYILAQFLSSKYNVRTDKYGGNIENRSRLIFEIIDGIRKATHPDFQIGFRLNLESTGVTLEENRQVVIETFKRGQIDMIDFAPWGYPISEIKNDLYIDPLLKYFMDIPRGDIKLGNSGRIIKNEHAQQLLDKGCDFVMIGRAAILDTEFANNIRLNPYNYQAPKLPVSKAQLKSNGLSDHFIDYMSSSWEEFVKS